MDLQIKIPKWHFLNLCLLKCFKNLDSLKFRETHFLITTSKNKKTIQSNNKVNLKSNKKLTIEKQKIVVK